MTQPELIDVDDELWVALSDEILCRLVTADCLSAS